MSAWELDQGYLPRVECQATLVRTGSGSLSKLYISLSTRYSSIGEIARTFPEHILHQRHTYPVHEVDVS